jgi:hypothetical protein
VIQSAQLDALAAELFKLIVTDNKLAIPAELETTSALVTPLPKAGEPPPATSAITNSFRVKFEFILQGAKAGQALRESPASDAAIARTSLAAAGERQPAGLTIAEPTEPETFHFASAEELADAPRFSLRSPAGADATLAAYQLPQLPELPQIPGTDQASIIANATAATVAATAATNAAQAANGTLGNAAASLPGQQSNQSLVVVPQSAPNIRVNVPVINTPAQKHRGLFNRGGNQQSRRPFLDRVFNGP